LFDRIMQPCEVARQFFELFHGMMV
jgi:hypothetical protein